MQLRDIAWGSLKRRRGRFGFAVAALMLGIGTVVALVSLSRAMRDEVGDQLDRFGANIIVTPKATVLGLPVHALRGVDLGIQEREFVALMGPSGCGKSTLLSLVGAMNPPTQGRVVIDRIDVYSLDVERRADFRREYLGFVFQQLYLMPFLTALQNVMLPLAAGRVPNARQRDMAMNALERVGLADKALRLPRDLSGGEQQRVAIARAVVNSPPLVLADEPTGCLDTETGRGIMERLLALREAGLTVFMVTHDATIARYADRIVRMRDGMLVTGD